MTGLKALEGPLVCYWPQVEMVGPITVLSCSLPLGAMLFLFLKASFISRQNSHSHFYPTDLLWSRSPNNPSSRSKVKALLKNF